MLRRGVAHQLGQLRSYFSFPKGSALAEVSQRTTPKPFDVDALTQAVREADEIQLHKKGHITTSVLKTELQIGRSAKRRRKKVKMGPREKYLFKKMRQRERANVDPDDPASDLTPLYEMTRPWWKFSRLENSKQRLRETPYTPEEHTAIRIIRQTLHQQQQPVMREPIVEAKGKLRPEYFQTAEGIRHDGEISLAEQIGTKLHKKELQTKHPYLRGISEESSDLQEALKKDPSFQQDALKLEAQSEELEDVESWIHNLKSFAERHSNVLESMDSSEPPSRARMDPPEATVGALGEDLKLEMAESGINVAELEQEAQREVESK